MSLYGGFQAAWSRRFPGCELPHFWEEDVRQNLVIHRQKVSELNDELEKEKFYVTYLERLLAEVEKHKQHKELVDPGSSSVEAESPEISSTKVGQVTTQNGRSISFELIIEAEKESREEKINSSDNKELTTSPDDDKSQFLLTKTDEASDISPAGNSTLSDDVESEEKQFVTVIKVNGSTTHANSKQNEVNATQKDSATDENSANTLISEALHVEEDDDSKSFQSDSSHSSPAVNKKKIPPKPPPKRPRPPLAYKGSFKSEDASNKASCVDSRIKSLPAGGVLNASGIKACKSLTKTESIKSNSSLDDYEEISEMLSSKSPQLSNNDSDYANNFSLPKNGGEYDDATLKSQRSTQSENSLSDVSRLTGGEVSPAAGLEEIEDDFASGAEMTEENSPKYSDYVNIDYFLKRRARLKHSISKQADCTGEGSLGTGVDYSDEDDDDGMGLLYQTLVNSGNACSTEDEEESNQRLTVIEQESALASEIDKPISSGILQETAGTRGNQAVLVQTEDHDVLDGDSGVYSSSVESTSYLWPSTPPTPPVGKHNQGTPAPSNPGTVANIVTDQIESEKFIGSVPDAAETERLTMVKCIVTSILESETVYWECLNVLLQYMKALRSTLDTSQPVIPREDLNAIFYKIPELHSLHLAFLDGLKNSVHHSDEKLAIGDHFKHLASRLGVYASYLQNYSHAIETVRKCSAENLKFSDITKSIKLQALKGQAVSLEDLLHKPVARVQKNALVLHDLLKYTSESNPNYKALQTALRMTQCFLNEFNMSATESMFPAHDRTQRHLVKNSFIVELSEGRRKLRHLFLFNDVIVCAKYKMSGREKFTYEVKWYIHLHEVVLPTEEGFVREVNPVNLLSLKSQVASIRDLITKEELASKEKSWGSGRNLDKNRKRLAELQAQIMLASPNLVFRIGHKNGRNYYFFLSSKFERCQWLEAITAVQATAPQTTTTLTLYELQAWITACHRFLQTNMGSFLLKTGKEDDLLVGDMHVIVHSMQELSKPSDIYLCLEVDSYGHYFRKAITEVCRCSVEPEWNQEFVIDLEGSQMLRILCYEEVPGHDPLIRGKAAIELNKSWLTNQFQEKKISLQDCTLSLSLKFIQRERTLTRVPSSKSCAVFGLKISQVVKREKRLVPFLVSCCLREVEKRGMHELGVYRVSGPASELQKLKRAFESNPYDAEQMVKEVDIHSVTGILKLYLRELPEGLFTDELYPKFLEAFNFPDSEAKAKTLLSLYNSLPSPNNVIINILIEHMIKVIKEELHNKMSLQNVATVFGPTLLRPSIKSDSGNMSDKLAAGTIDVMAQAGILYFYLKKRAAGESLVIPTI